jgi:hypothetical protein
MLLGVCYMTGWRYLRKLSGPGGVLRRVSRGTYRTGLANEWRYTGD